MHLTKIRPVGILLLTAQVLGGGASVGVALDADAGDEGDLLERSTLAWEGRLRWLASARLSGEDGADWSAAQQGVLTDGILTIGESWEGLRPGHVAELRATWSPRGGATGALRFDGEDVAWIDGYALTAVRSSACR
jgi:hypothetical protein